MRRSSRRRSLTTLLLLKARCQCFGRVAGRNDGTQGTGRKGALSVVFPNLARFLASWNLAIGSAGNRMFKESFARTAISFLRTVTGASHWTISGMIQLCQFVPFGFEVALRSNGTGRRYVIRKHHYVAAIYCRLSSKREDARIGTIAMIMLTLVYGLVDVFERRRCLLQTRMRRISCVCGSPCRQSPKLFMYPDV
jgi:hypothetical protein